MVDGASVDGGADVQQDSASSDAAQDGPLHCDPVQHFSANLPQAVPLACDANHPAVLFDFAVPATGNAVARATLVVSHVDAATNAVTHFWNAHLEVGTPTLAFAVGDDVCPGVTHTRSNLGTGSLSTSAGHVRVLSYEGAAPCTDGALSVLAGSTLDVWVESPDPACAGKYIAAQSFYEEVHVDTNVLWVWPTSMAPVVSVALPTGNPGEKLLVLSTIEGSPRLDPNTMCGSEASTLVSQTSVDGAVVATSQDVVPASQGMGHLVLSTEATLPVMPGSHDVTLLAGSNFSTTMTTTGGCCGDAIVAAIRTR
jgi:hypothetical protein